jgi:hypothetical protein
MPVHTQHDSMVRQQSLERLVEDFVNFARDAATTIVRELPLALPPLPLPAAAAVSSSISSSGSLTSVGLATTPSLMRTLSSSSTTSSLFTDILSPTSPLPHTPLTFPPPNQTHSQGSSSNGTPLSSLPSPTSGYKTIVPLQEQLGLAGGEKYRHGHVLFKFARDKHGLFGNNDNNAGKSARNEIRAQSCVVACGVPNLHTTLSAVFIIRGHCIYATAIAPISAQTIVYGSSRMIFSIHATLLHCTLFLLTHDY